MGDEDDTSLDARYEHFMQPGESECDTVRIRSIKPEFWRSDDITGHPIPTRLTFIGLWSYVDDNGVGLDKLSSIVADLYADDLARNPQETLQRVADDLLRLSEGGQVVRYQADGKHLMYITNWTSHQLVNHPSKGHEYPLPSAETVSGAKVLKIVSSDTRETRPQEQGSRGAGEQGAGEQGRALALRDEARVPAKAATPRSRILEHKMTEDWVPQQATIEWLESRYPGVDFEREAHDCREHFLDKPTIRRAGWERTFKKWIERGAERGTVRMRSGRRRPSPLQGADAKAAGWQQLKGEMG